MFNFGRLMKHSFCWILSKRGNGTKSFFEAAIHNAGSLNREKNAKEIKIFINPCGKKFLIASRSAAAKGKFFWSAASTQWTDVVSRARIGGKAISLESGQRALWWLVQVPRVWIETNRKKLERKKAKPTATQFEMIFCVRKLSERT